MLSENGTRKGERAKKVPKYMQYDDADYGIFPPARTAEQKEKQATAAEIAQIARLLQKFLSTLNQKLRDYDQHEQQERLSANLQNGPETDLTKVPPLQPAENAVQKAGGAQGGGKRVRDGGQQKTVRGESRKPAGGLSSKQTVSSSLQVDQDYHGMLNEHLRGAYPNISSFSPEMLRGLDIPRQLLQANGKGNKWKEERKGSQGKGKGKDELKPFKRQSYHVAIAYHIHLKRMKILNPSAIEIDPTYPARKLRESQQQQ